ncbi:MAG: aldo/keto reductase [archaeon]|nr:aldo/keto reductase [archaeon]
MVKRVVKKNGDEIFPIGLGCMRFPTNKGSIDEEITKEFLLYGLDNGINYLDTAYAYHNGENEPFLGEILKIKDENGVSYRDKVKLATKLPSWLVKSREDMDMFLTEQLERLQTDYIDYYYVHNVDLTALKRLEDLGVYDFLDKAKEKGLIKNACFSFHGSPNEFTELVDHYDWDGCLVQYNYLDTKIQAGIEGIKYAHSKGLAVFIMEPLKGGLLARSLPDKAERLFKEKDPSRSNANWALSWLLNHEEITCVLSGIDNLDKMKENLAIGHKVKPNSFSDEEITTVNEVQEIIQSLLKINCATCGYCLPCPRGVNIPECFSIYNDKYLFDKKGLGPISNAFMRYCMMVGGVTNKKANAGLCNQCGRCSTFCPQFLDVPNELKRVKKEFEKPGFNYMMAFFKKVGLPLFTKATSIFDLFKDF